AEPDQGLPRGRGGGADLNAAAHDTGAAGGRPLIGGQLGVALDEGDAVEPDTELFGGHLRDRGAQPGAEIDLAAIERDRAVFVDGDETVDLVGGVRPRRRGLRAL